MGGFDTIGSVLAEIYAELRPHDPVRFNVIRTRFTEDRAPISTHLRTLVYKRDNFACVWCGSCTRLELDHVVPWSAGGSDTIDNLRTLCHDCNAYRSNTGYSLDLACRQIPSGYECVYCNDELLGDPELRPIFCMNCQHKAAGIRSSMTPPPGWEETEAA
ncbi:HNH endonuclease [Mycobacterium avium subsp. hominissuis]|nr:HNH endonuclease [Mycobacterium avium subsp. hominissuis]